MRLVELGVQRMPGIREPFRLGPDALGPGVHLIHGPNGSGKTTLCRALRAILWPQTVDGRPISVEARFEDAGSVWHARREGEEVEWRRDGAASGPPLLPEERFARCFLSTVDDFYIDDRDGRRFAEWVLKEMAGGYDVRPLRGEEHFLRGKQHGYLQEAAHGDAVKRLGQVEREQEAILREERELASRERELEEARAAAREAEALQAARQMAEARARAAAAERELAGLPRGIEQLRGNEGVRLEEFEGELDRVRGSRNALDERERAARKEAESACLEFELSAELLSEQRERLDELREREAELRRLEEQVSASRARREGARAALGPAADLERLLRAGAPELEKLERLLRDAQVLAGERAVLEARRRALAAAAPAASGDSIALAIRALNRWLRAPEGGAKAAGVWTWVLLAVAALAFLALGTLHHPAWLAFLAVVARAAWRLLRAQPESGQRGACETELARSGVTPPGAWIAEAVERRLSELEDERAVFKAAERDAVRRTEVDADLAGLAQREETLGARREELRGALGFEATGDLALADLAAARVELRTANGQVLENEGRAKARAGERDRLRDDLASFLRAHGEEPATETAGTARALTSLEKRSAALREARAELARVARGRSEIEATLASLEGRRAKLFAAAGLEPGDEVGLVRRLELLPRWAKADDELRAAALALRQLESALEGAPELAALEPVEVEERLDHARQALQRREEIAGEISAIKTRVQDARRRSDLEEAAAVAEAARGVLLEAYEDALHASAGLLLVEEVEREHPRVSQPEVLQRARALFAAFTHHRYELEVRQDGEAVELRAIDTTDPGRGLAPEELSSGTRVQMLLAARLAFATTGEHGVRLPLFLDDALATSDPDRIRAVGASLFALAREEHRQVIVLTTDEGDVALLRQAAEGAPLRVVDLARLRRTQGAEACRERLELPAAEDVPEVAGRDGPEYAQALGVPPLDPRRDVEHAHLYYLLPDDLELLRRLLSWRTDRLGPLRSRAAHGAATFLQPAELARIETWARVTQSVLSSWRVGRGKPIDREALAEAGLGKRWLDPLGELAAELGGDAKRWLEIVTRKADPRAKGFYGHVLDRIREQLVLGGYLDPEDNLTREQAWERLLRDLADLELALCPGPDELRQRFDFLWERCLEGR